MDTTKLLNVLDNKHLCQFAAILSVARSVSWRLKHKEFPLVIASMDDLAKCIKSPLINKESVIDQWFTLFAQIVEEDPKLFYRDSDVYWFCDVLDNNSNSEISMILSMLLALASTPKDVVTCEQLAEETNLEPGSWRNKAASGEVIGAYKVGGKTGTWLFPILSLRAYGIDAIAYPQHMGMDVVLEDFPVQEIGEQTL